MRAALPWLPVLLLLTPAWAQRAGDAPGPPEAIDPEVAASFDIRLDAVARTESMLVDKITDRTAQVRLRVRALYELARAGQAGLWLDPTERRARLDWQVATRRVLDRDLKELEQFRAELASTRAARARLEADRRAATGVHRPAPRSLRRPLAGEPVRGFGPFTDDDSGARLSRRGIELHSRAGDEVGAVAGGTVAWAGPLRGLDHAVIVDHGGFLSVVARLSSAEVAAGQRVTAGQVLGRAAAGRVYLEIRLPVGPEGLPSDPAPLLAH
ncbi:MAG TPA: peptidoglycan DD-metalloendopeptidase family protein [Kofleriaceae bacterium]|nr:peptidoglycan DD-metalloendopeptidase family protein [Kofleriaceae bacterium]